MNQLIREDNTLMNATYVYTYDRSGNITGISKHTLAEGEVQNDENTYSQALSYSESEWGDLLTQYVGQTSTYDSLGNPINYRNGLNYTFTWEGRCLVGATRGSNVYYFTYNKDGLRTTKTKNGVTTNYYYSGSLLIQEESPAHTMVYLYDANGSPVGFKYRTPSYAEDVWDEYFYEKNLFGDIVAVYSASGIKLLSYNYNAWGAISITSYNNAISTTANKNPLKYRGYYYDSDLGFYYLQSRYYDIRTCRFINADGYVSTGQGILGYNMFAYCNNNPVMYVDPTGYWATYVDFDEDDYDPLDDEDKFASGGGGSSNGNAGNVYVGSSSGAGSASGKGTSAISGNASKPNSNNALPKNGIKVNSSTGLQMASDFLGEGYKEASPGRYVSADGTRQIRISNADILGQHAGGPHINFDILIPKYKSVHVYICL